VTMEFSDDALEVRKTSSPSPRSLSCTGGRSSPRIPPSDSTARSNDGPEWSASSPNDAAVLRLVTAVIVDTRHSDGEAGRESRRRVGRNPAGMP
jgi:hypothetical protein